MTPARPGILRELVDTLEADGTLVAEVADAIRATVPGYETVPEASLAASIRRNLDLTFRTLLAGRAPDPEEIDEAEELALERMDQGVAIGTVLAGFRVCMRVILGRLLDLAPDRGLPAEEVLAVSTQLWALGDSFSTRAVVVHQERSIARALADSTRRARWIVDAVLGGLSPAALHEGAAASGLAGEGPVRAVRAHALDPGSTVDELLALLHAWARTAEVEVLLAPHGAGAVGILRGDPAPGPQPARAVLAVGPAGPWEELPASGALAARVLEGAERVGRSGTTDLGSLSWRLGIASSPEVSALLRRQIVDPVRAEGEFSDFLLDAVRAYLAHGLSIPRAAASIPVHVNTLRYRLKRFRELTGTDLHDPEDLIEVSWALADDAGAASRARPAAARPRPGAEPVLS